VVLACSNLNGCSTTPLVGFGFNPTIVRAPEHLRRGGVEFIGTDRFEQNNKMVTCHNHNLHRYIRNNSSTARLLLLDKRQRVLKRTEIYGGRCMRFRYSAVDARLLVVGSMLYMSYANMWGNPECRGHFLAQLKLRLDAPPDNQFNRLAELASTEVTGGLNVMGSPGKLLSVRNGGVLVDRNRISMELSDVAPITEVLTATGRLSHFPAPFRFSTFMHNSIHPIWVTELSAFLGVGHRHLRNGYGTDRSIIPTAPFQYGYSYRHIFFTFDNNTRRIVRFSREFCIAALDGTKTRAAPVSSPVPSNTCDGITFVMGAFRRNDAPATISFSYGINDCESALLTLSVARLDTLLEF
jgi:hypothetical protein